MKTAGSILQEVSKSHNIPTLVIKGISIRRDIVKARHEVVSKLKKEGGLTPKAIAEFMNMHIGTIYFILTPESKPKPIFVEPTPIRFLNPNLYKALLIEEALLTEKLENIKKLIKIYSKD